VITGSDASAPLGRARRSRKHASLRDRPAESLQSLFAAGIRSEEDGEAGRQCKPSGPMAQRCLCTSTAFLEADSRSGSRLFPSTRCERTHSRCSRRGVDIACRPNLLAIDARRPSTRGDKQLRHWARGPQLPCTTPAVSYRRGASQRCSPAHPRQAPDRHRHRTQTPTRRRARGHTRLCTNKRQWPCAVQ